MNRNGKPHTGRLRGLGYSAAAVAILVCAGVYASQSYHPPGSGEAWNVAKVYLKSSADEPRARGVVAFICNESERQHRIQVYAKNLKPGTVYSLWLRRFEGERLVSQKRVTRRLFAPRTNRRGVFKHVSTVLECPVAGYDDVALTPGTGPPSGVALVGAIPEDAHGEDDEGESETLGPPGSGQ